MSIKKLLVMMLFLQFSLTTFGLKVGDKAVDLDIKNWVKNGPVKLEKGKIYVVEFWATWCPPCRTSIPHLSVLQKKYKNDGVVVVGITFGDKDNVEKFVKKQKNMDYSVASDMTGKVFKAYMKEYRTIPKAFVVDKKGIVVWIGQPSDLDDVLVKVIKDEAVSKRSEKMDLKKKLERAEEKIKLDKNNAEAYIDRLGFSHFLGDNEKWLETFRYLDKKNKLKTSNKLMASFLESIYKAKEILNNIKKGKFDVVSDQLDKTLKNKEIYYKYSVLVCIIYYNYSKVLEGEKNLFNDKVKSILLDKIEAEVKTTYKKSSYGADLLNLKANLYATFKDYRAAIKAEIEAIELIKKLSDDYVEKSAKIKLFKKNLATYKKQLQKVK